MVLGSSAPLGDGCGTDVTYCGGMIAFVRSNVLPSRFIAWLSALGLAALLLALPVPAQAHSVLLGTTPEDEEQLATAPDEVTLLFNEDITALGTEVVVTTDDGEIVSEGEVEIKGPEVIQGLADERPAGAYTVTWRAVSADGHPISGVYVFTASEAAGDGAAEEPTEDPATEEEASEEATPDADPDEAETEPADDSGDSDAEDSGALSSSTWVVIGVLILAAIILVTMLSRSLAANKRD